MPSDLPFTHLSPGPGVHILVTNRGRNEPGKFGFNLATHVNDDPNTVAVNRKKLAQALAPLPNPIWLEQVHGNDIEEVSAPAERLPRADGSFTRLANQPLAILTADCLPIVLFSSSELAVVHAGWRGLANGIIDKAIALFQQSPSAWVGPGISANHYEVDDAVARHFPKSPALTPATSGKERHYQFDLKAEASIKLKRAGALNVEVSDSCTASDQRYYSHRAEGPTGRFATIAWREWAGEND